MPMEMTPDHRRPITERADVAAIGVDGREYLHRPGHLLAISAHADALRSHLDSVGVGVTARSESGGIVRFTVDPAHDVHGTASELAGRGLRVSPNHVLTAEPVYLGGPGGPVRPSGDPLDDLGPPEGLPGHGVVVGVLDTAEVHHPWLSSRYRLPTRDLSTDNHDSVLDEAHGHGTFVAGVVLQAAPGVQIAVAGVLDMDGVGDDFTVAMGLDHIGDVHIINLSLGGYTFDDQPPVATDAALSRLSSRIAVVCAAGNNNSDRPFWPAADQRFVSVAALNPETGDKAAFSNDGPWVRASAVGVDINSTYPTYEGMLPGRQMMKFDEWARWEGTSFATPHVAGRIAALMTTDGLGAPEAAARLLASAPRDPRLGVRID
jgi:hypothetical protein